MDLNHLDLDDLAHRCEENTKKFHRQQSHDSRFCFELLRRAFIDGVPEATTRVYQIYENQVRSWVYRHSRYPETTESPDFLANVAFGNFFFALRGEKFNDFHDLPSLLSYLKACVHSAILKYIADSSELHAQSLDEVDTADETSKIEENINLNELWDQVCRLLPDEQDRLLAKYVFDLGLKPEQIASAYPELWPNARQVSVALQRIRRTLRRDETLCQWAGQTSQEV